MTSVQDTQVQEFHLNSLDEREEIELGLGKEPHSGDLCPKCRTSQLDYDGLLNLTCPHCGHAMGGCFT